MSTLAIEQQSVIANVAEFCASQGINPDDLEIGARDFGGNNQGFVLHSGDQKFFLKRYFQGGVGSRDRLASEWAFLDYALHCQVRTVPRPVWRDPNGLFGVYEYVAGRKLTPGEINGNHVAQFARFFGALNGEHRETGVAQLIRASDGCSSIDENVEGVKRRLEQLAGIDPQKTVNRAALELVAKLESQLRQSVERLPAPSKSVRYQLERGEHCVSPSDFGFHNALLRADGQLCFIDFEYAGWDDPAKMIADLFCQPEIPIPFEHFDRFATTCLHSGFANREVIIERAQALLPIVEIKWCCIMLNEFLSDSVERRRFADPERDEVIHREMQLEKIKRYLTQSKSVAIQ
ncbi:MAG: aminoglycoside phosphotransferase family protein [Pseudomonadota bacterium]